MVDMDWKAAMDSEVFREYAKNEIYKMQVKAQQVQQQQNVDNDEQEKLRTLEQFKALELEVRASPKKLAVFRALQNKFATDPEYTSRVKVSFVNAVMMLDLS